MRHYSAAIPRFCAYGVSPASTHRAIRHGYVMICRVLGMNPDKRRVNRTAAEQRAVSGYGSFISQVIASGKTGELWTPVYTVSDLNRGTVICFIAETLHGGSQGLDLEKIAELSTPWKPPFERFLDEAALARSADMGMATDTLDQSFVWLMTGCSYAPGTQSWTWQLTPGSEQNP